MGDYGIEASGEKAAAEKLSGEVGSFIDRTKSFRSTTKVSSSGAVRGGRGKTPVSKCLRSICVCESTRACVLRNGQQTNGNEARKEVHSAVRYPCNAAYFHKPWSGYLTPYRKGLAARGRER